MNPESRKFTICKGDKINETPRPDNAEKMVKIKEQEEFELARKLNQNIAHHTELKEEKLNKTKRTDLREKTKEKKDAA